MPTGHSTEVLKPTLDFQSGADFGEVVGEVVGRARPVGAVHDDDRLRRQLGARVELLDRGVVPVLDLAEENPGERGTVDHDLTRLDAFDIDDRHDAAHDHRELDEPVLVELLALERRVAGAERHGLVLDLLDAAAGTDRLVVQPDAGLLLVGIRPFGVDRVGKCRPGAGDIQCDRGRKAGNGDDAGGHQSSEMSQGSLLLWRTKFEPHAGHGPRLRVRVLGC